MSTLEGAEMPRRNRREPHPPLDLTPADVVPVQRPKPLEAGESVWRRREKRERENYERQRQARMREGIDWSICLVPGCGEELRVFGHLRHPKSLRDPERELPLCDLHAVVVWKRVQEMNGQPAIIETAERLRAQDRARAFLIHEADKLDNRTNQQGHIYFVRLNGLVKAGWSGNLYDRLRAYGPDVEILCHYPATRQDETTLHRQLRPVLAKGREWYHDCDVVRLFIDEAIRKHGKPTIRIDWTQPKGPVTKPRNWR